MFGLSILFTSLLRGDWGFSVFNGNGVLPDMNIFIPVIHSFHLSCTIKKEKGRLYIGYTRNMKIKVSDYVADFLVNNGIDTAFSVTGGGAMHLNDGLGHKQGLHVIYNHHEQACAIAAEAYARIHNRIAAVCVTTGPGGTNAITGVVGGWLDSIPMLILSGQVRYDTTARGMGLNLRAGGDQEFDIIKAISCMTKYCEMVIDPLRIRYALEKALYTATHGRPGPCWLDIPLNVQGAWIDPDVLTGFDAATEAVPEAPETDAASISAVLTSIRGAKRPVFYAGNGIRLARGFEVFRRVIRKLNIPVVTGWDNIDMMADEDPLYVGRGGGMGDRAGNFAVQNADVILSVGSRLSIRQVGYNWKTWAREAYVMMVDVDAEELKKPTLHVELPIHADAKDFLEKLDARLSDTAPFYAENGWQQTCRNWKANYPVVQPRHYADLNANVYAFMRDLSARLPEGAVTVVGNGSACVVGSQTYAIKNDQRFIINSAIASMGYDLPAAVGVACAFDAKKDIICITGDGSIQMNLQELQTILTNHLPIRLFVINNQGYHSIRQTQSNLFGEHCKVGIGPESHDLGFPALEKLAAAYGYTYYSVHENAKLTEFLDRMMNADAPVIGEIFVSVEQKFEPKSATRRLEDGRLFSPPLEDLAPFLDRDELRRNMFIPLIDE